MVVALLLIERLAVPDELEAAAALSDASADELGSAEAGEPGAIAADAVAAVVSATFIEAAVGKAPPPHATSNVAAKTNTAVTALDDFMGSLLVERVSYVAVRRHSLTTEM
jgi:hypothetical protein